MTSDNIRLHDLTNIGSPGETFTEIAYIVRLIDPSFDTSFIESVFKDIVRLFNGEYPGYRASNTKYHNLEHTCAVTLATARLAHGVHVRGRELSPGVIQLGIIGALFHDSGLIQTDKENNGTGAQYTIGHEERSIALMRDYLSDRNFPEEDILDCSHIIQCTILSLSTRDIPFRSKEIEIMGKILGSADLSAQMADRNYLEKLPLLFLEFQEAGMEGYETPLELFQNTEEFYHSVARTRLREELDNVASAYLYHFQNRWQIDQDLYAVSIENNIRYIRKATTDCTDSYECLMSKLRRK